MSSTIDPDTLLIFLAGNPPPEISEVHGGFDVWIRRRIGHAWRGRYRSIDVREHTPTAELLNAGAIVITGSPASVTERAPWMIATEAFLADAVREDRVPILGICFGHQILAQALGGNVARNPFGREIGTVEVNKNEHDPLFEGLDDRFVINATHVDSIERRPPGAKVLASTSLEPTAAFRVGRAWGVQFHPEVDREGMQAYLQSRRAALEPEGIDVDALMQGADECPAGTQILRNFATYASRR